MEMTPNTLSASDYALRRAFAGCPVDPALSDDALQPRQRTRAATSDDGAALFTREYSQTASFVKPSIPCERADRES